MRDLFSLATSIIGSMLFAFGSLCGYWVTYFCEGFIYGNKEATSEIKDDENDR